MVARLKFEYGIHSWEIEGDPEECEKIDMLWREKYKDTCHAQPKIKYGTSAKGERTFSVEYDNDDAGATTVRGLVGQLQGMA